MAKMARGVRPSCYQDCELTEAGCNKAVAEKGFVNLERLRAMFDAISTS